MKICGCEDAEKGYVIINPDSPDRKQILSLNPPICHEMIGNSLEIDGEIYIFKKEIQDWTITPLAGGLKVDWSPSDFDIIGGTSGEIEPIYEPAYSGHYRIDRMPYVTNSGTLFVFVTRYVFTKFLPSWRINPESNNYKATQLYVNAGGGAPCLSVSQVNTQLANNPQWVTYFREQRNATIPNSVVDPVTGRIWVQNQPIPQSAIVAHCGYIVGQTIVGYKVTSNTAETSERETETEPTVTLLAGNCGLQINYTDDTSSGVIESPQCPQNIKKIESLEITDTGGILEQIAPAPSGEIVISCGERECPPETCFNCDCSELNCCYDESGKLIDSFIRRT